MDQVYVGGHYDGHDLILEVSPKKCGITLGHDKSSCQWFVCYLQSDWMLRGSQFCVCTAHEFELSGTSVNS